MSKIIKAALITGASSGIGAATAIHFSKQGYFVYLMGRNKDRLLNVALECPSGASVLACDITDGPAVLKRLKEATSNPQHQIEVLVNNAGIYHQHKIEDGSDELWLEEFNTNLLGSVRITRELFPYFRERKKGSIVNVSSTLALRPVAGTSAYSAIKAAMRTWTQSLAIEGAPHIRANVVCPGLVETPIHGLDNLPAEKKQAVLDKMNSMQPLQRVGTPEEIAKTIFFLASEDSSWTTGATISVDGGIFFAGN